MSNPRVADAFINNSETQPFYPPKIEEEIEKPTICGYEVNVCCNKKKCTNLVKSYFPFLTWLPKYRWHWLQCDIIAGLTVGLTVIPQGLAYAQIAGLPVQYGLYSAFMGGFIYCIFGTSKDVTLGPTAIMSLLVHSYGNEDPVQAVLLTLLAGIIQLGMGLFRLGFIMRFISVPVISGFTSAAAITIALGQFKHLFGVKTPTNDFFPELIDTLENLGKTNVWDLVMGLSCIVCLVLLRYVKDWVAPESPDDTRSQKVAKKLIWLFSTGRNAIVVISAGLVAYAIHTQYITSCKVPDCLTLTGKIDEGLPPFEVPAFSEVKDNKTITAHDLVQNIGAGFVVVPLMGLLESIAIGRAFAAKNGYLIDTNQEMIAIGTANVVSSFVSSYCITGSFSRTAINAQSNVKTTAGGIFTGAIVILSLALLTPSFYYIPKSALAAVIISAVIYMFDYATIVTLWRVKKIDLIPLVVTFLVSFWQIPYGILAGAGISLIILLYPSTFPTVRYSMLPKGSGSRTALVFSPEQGLYYPAAEYVADKIRRVINDDDPARDDVDTVIVDTSKLSNLDYTGIRSFVELAAELSKRDIELVFIQVDPRMAEDLQKADKFGNFKFDSTANDVTDLNPSI